MELKTRYKQTEIGMIPEDWEVDKLKRFWNVIDCKHLTAKFVENGIPLASIREVQSRFVELENAKQTTQPYYLALIEGGRKPQPGDLIFSRNATVGEIAQVAEWHPPFAMGQDVCLLRKKYSSFSSDYLQAVIRSPIVLKQFANFMVGSTFKRVNIKQIQNLVVPMPLPEEQTAIATVLSDLDLFMESLDKLIAKKRDIKQATMHQLLTGRMQLPEFGGELKSSYKQTEVGIIPEDWVVKTLGEVASKERPICYGIVQTGKSVDNGVPCIRVVDFNNGKIKKENLITTSKDISNSYKRTILKEGDLVIALRGKIGELAIIDKALIGSNLTRGVALIAISDSLDPSFFLQQLSSYNSKVIFEKNLNGSALQEIPINVLRKILVPFPPSKSEQQAIATILSDIDAEIAALEQKRDKTLVLKQGMMQELLTGKTRLL